MEGARTLYRGNGSISDQTRGHPLPSDNNFRLATGSHCWKYWVLCKFRILPHSRSFRWNNAVFTFDIAEASEQVGFS